MAPSKISLTLLVQFSKWNEAQWYQKIWVKLHNFGAFGCKKHPFSILIINVACEYNLSFSMT